MVNNQNKKVAIVTGGGRGLGRAMALELCEAGMHVVITSAREYEEIKKVARDANDKAGDERIKPVKADVTEETDCTAVVDFAISAFGRIDILVNNAGRGMKYVSQNFMTKPTKFWEVEPETWRTIIGTNVNGPFFMARSVIPHMLSNKWGRIINISMNHETMRRKGFSPYGPSKAALESETIIWSQDLEGTGITVNALLPGGASNTGMIPDSIPDEIRLKLLDPGIMIPPLLWLISGEADSFTGKRINASKWDTSLPADKAAEKANESAGWVI